MTNNTSLGSSEDHLELYKTQLSSLRKVQMREGVSDTFYERLKQNYQFFNSRRIKESFQGLRASFLHSANKLEEKFLSQYEQLLALKIAVDKEKREIEKWAGVRLSVENLLMIESLATKKKKELDDELLEKRQEIEQKLTQYQEEWGGKIAELEDKHHLLNKSYESLQKEHSTLLESSEEKKQEIDAELQKRKNQAQHILEELQIKINKLTETYHSTSSLLKDKEVAFELQLKARMDAKEKEFTEKQSAIGKEVLELKSGLYQQFEQEKKEWRKSVEKEKEKEIQLALEVERSKWLELESSLKSQLSTLTDKLTEIQQRSEEESVSSQKEVESLRAQVVNIPTSIERAVKDAEELVSENVKLQYESEKNILKREYEADLRDSKRVIIKLEEKVIKLSDVILTLKERCKKFEQRIKRSELTAKKENSASNTQVILRSSRVKGY